MKLKGSVETAFCFGHRRESGADLFDEGCDALSRLGFARTLTFTVDLDRIKEQTVGGALHGSRYAIASNFYRIPRLLIDLVGVGFPPVYPVEAFILVEDESRKNDLIERFGGGHWGNCVVEELQGIAHKLCGTYRPPYSL